MRRPKNSTDYIVEDRGYVTPCWIWQLAKSEKGYGKKHVGGRSVRAHRMYYERVYGPITDGMVCDHLCRVRDCVNPDHIEIVTSATNCHRGDMTHLNAETVINIRQSHDLTFRQMSERFGISISGAKQVYYGYCWKSIPFEQPPPRKRGRRFSRKSSPSEQC